MATSKDPEQRPATPAPEAQPAGEEVTQTSASPVADEAGLRARTSEPEELREVAAEVRRQTVRLYAKGRAYAGGRATPFVGGAFLLGLLAGLLLGRD